MKAEKEVFQPEDLLEELKAEGWKEKGVEKNKIAGAKAAQKYIKQIVKMHVFTAASTSIDLLLKPRHLSDVDLSGLSDEVADYIAFRLLSDIYEKVSSGILRFRFLFLWRKRIGLFLLKARPGSSRMIKKIAAEGRKFGVFLVVITQRPSKIHPDALSQCNSQIVMRLTNPDDQQAIARSSERLGTEFT